MELIVYWTYEIYDTYEWQALPMLYQLFVLAEESLAVIY